LRLGAAGRASCVMDLSVAFILKDKVEPGKFRS